MRLILDGNEIQDIQSFHNKIQEVLDLPDYYGKNLDALWDCLTGWVEIPVTLIWVGFEKNKIDLGDYAEKTLSLFKKAEQEIKGFKIELR